MFHTTDFTVWNLTPGCQAGVGAQRIFNILGTLNHPQAVNHFLYRLNNGPEKRIFFNATEKRLSRLQRKGNFSIDTIRIDELQSENQILFRIVGHDGAENEYELTFNTKPFSDDEPCFHLDLTHAAQIEQAAEVVDGKWQISQDNAGERCLELRKEDIGYDRIILFGRHDWTTGYEVTARLGVTHISSSVHNLGLLFKWNAHLAGDGLSLPTQWSTGLGYYVSSSLGLRIRYGVDVRRDPSGTKVGDFVLAEKPLSGSKQVRWLVRHNHHALGNLQNRVMQLLFPSAQLATQKHYRFRLRVHPTVHALTFWEHTKPEPEPQVVVENPTEHLMSGAVGVIAYHCAVRLYEFDVLPLRVGDSGSSNPNKHLKSEECAPT